MQMIDLFILFQCCKHEYHFYFQCLFNSALHFSYYVHVCENILPFFYLAFQNLLRLQTNLAISNVQPLWDCAISNFLHRPFGTYNLVPWNTQATLNRTLSNCLLWWTIFQFRARHFIHYIEIFEKMQIIVTNPSIYVLNS